MDVAEGVSALQAGVNRRPQPSQNPNPRFWPLLGKCRQVRCCNGIHCVSQPLLISYSRFEQITS